jgi:hypothetical protein
VVFAGGSNNSYALLQINFFVELFAILNFLKRTLSLDTHTFQKIYNQQKFLRKTGDYPLRHNRCHPELVEG